MTSEDICLYLKQAMELEASVYMQERAISDAQKTLQKKKPYLKTVKPKQIDEPQKPEEEEIDSSSEQLNKKWLIYGAVEAVVGIIFIALGSTAVGIFIALCAIFTIIYAFKAQESAKKKNIEKSAKNSASARDYELALEKYNQNKKDAEIEYARNKEEAQAVYSDAMCKYEVTTKAVRQLYPPLEETKSILQKLYDLDILFPKYRNLVAVSTMYEYFASGRVTALEGADGAYNLYEQELRLNLIINKMDVIISQLEDIKANQYALYNELKRANSNLEGIRSDVSELLNTTHEIADATRITACCSQVTAQNTEALKYLSLVNG